MGRTKRFQRFFLMILLLGVLVMTMSGCAYVNNRNWDDMTPEEQEEVRQSFEEEREELEEYFSDDNFAAYILDKVEQSIQKTE